MKWDEFRSLLVGLDHKTSLGRIVSIRCEDDEEILKTFTPNMMKIRSDWRRRTAKALSQEEMDDFLETMKQAFIQMAGGVKN